MARKYVRKTRRGADGDRYNREDLRTAIADVMAGRKTKRGAAKFYNIPRTTLHHYLNGSRGQKGLVASGGRGGGGKNSLPLEDERNLAEGLKTLDFWGFGLTRQEVLDTVETYVKGLNLKTKFRNGRPSEEWFLAFKKRHNLSIKKPQSVEYLRINQVNPWTIYGFYDLLEEQVKNLGLEHKPECIYNLDETSFCHDPSKSKVVGLRGSKSVRMTSSPGRENTSVLMCVSASGRKLPPLIIFKGKNVMESWIQKEISNQTSFAATKRGWMESEVFRNWFEKCFLQQIPDERPILIIYDGHSTHINYKLIKSASDNNVTILKLPPHTSHILQPLDVAVFRGLKSEWDKDLVKWQRANPRRKIPKQEFVNLLTKIYENMNVENITHGFNATGIYPVDRKVINENKFRPADLESYKQSKEKGIAEVQQHIVADSGLPEFLHQENRIEELPIVYQQEYETSPQPQQNVAPATASIASTTKKSPKKLRPTVNPTPFQNILLSYVKETKQANSPTTKKRRICSGAEVITTEQFIEMVKKKDEEEAAKIAAKTAKTTKTDCKTAQTKTKNNYMKKKTAEDEDSEDSDETEPEDEYEYEDTSENEVCKETEIAVLDYVIVEFQDNLFPGQVIAKNNEIYRIKHMEKAGKIGWKWPQKEDVLDYDREDIQKIIPAPQPINKRGLFRVSYLDD